MSGPALRRRLLLERRVDMADGGGGLTAAWAPVSTVWADIRPVAPRERIAAAAIGSLVSHRLVMRRVPDESPCHLRATDRLREGGRVFSIIGMADGPEGFLTVWADEEAVA